MSIQLGAGSSLEAGIGLGSLPPPPPTINFTTPAIMNSGAFVSLLQPCASAISWV